MADNTIVCVPVDGALIDPRWGRAHRLALATAIGGRIVGWDEFVVDWDRLHDEGGEGTHHARIARVLREHKVNTVVADHMGEPMAHMLEKMQIEVHLGAEGDARAAVETAIRTP